MPAVPRLKKFLPGPPAVRKIFYFQFSRKNFFNFSASSTIAVKNSYFYFAYFLRESIAGKPHSCNEGERFVSDFRYTSDGLSFLMLYRRKEYSISRAVASSLVTPDLLRLNNAFFCSPLHFFDFRDVKVFLQFIFICPFRIYDFETFTLFVFDTVWYALHTCGYSERLGDIKWYVSLCGRRRYRRGRSKAREGYQLVSSMTW